MICDGAAGCLVSKPSKMVATVAPWKGNCPVAISYNTTPAEKTSLRASISCPRACSGDMYDTVPMVVPIVVS